MWYTGTPGYWRTLEEVEAEGSNPMSRNAPSPWVSPFSPCLSSCCLAAVADAGLPD